MTYTPTQYIHTHTHTHTHMYKHTYTGPGWLMDLKGTLSSPFLPCIIVMLRFSHSTGEVMTVGSANHSIKARIL